MSKVIKFVQQGTDYFPIWVDPELYNDEIIDKLGIVDQLPVPFTGKRLLRKGEAKKFCPRIRVFTKSQGKLRKHTVFCSGSKLADLTNENSSNKLTTCRGNAVVETKLAKFKQR